MEPPMTDGRLSAGRQKFRGRSSCSAVRDEGCHHKSSEPELPRRCLVIKRTHPEDGVERTELRLVTYQKAGRKVDQAHVLMEAAQYLQERADDAECGGGRGHGNSHSTTYESVTGGGTKLVRYFSRRADESDDREWSIITGLAERLLLDVTDCVRKERPLSCGLLNSIKELNNLAKSAMLNSEFRQTAPAVRHK
ncbi:unnamed protein product [Nippostrongylus brasiliensis]|uniref:Uncharacterized protein n=1 Tax=Nippostrongylus brasiliensis TaxID=27835 RepID=A0A0N4YJG3_NIPBR|nr:unnamed protein product [Nippostrongylus brasiliensis]